MIMRATTFVLMTYDVTLNLHVIYSTDEKIVRYNAKFNHFCGHNVNEIILQNKIKNKCKFLSKIPAVLQ